MNFVSSMAVINQFARRFKPIGSGWVATAIEDIGGALSILHMHGAMIETSCDVTITSYRGKIPCTVEAIERIEYGGCFLPLVKKGRVPQDTTLDQLTINHVTINGPYLRPNWLETGILKVHYLTAVVDNQGFPSIPDNQILFDALQWYILMNYLLAGNKHSEFNYEKAEARWERDIPRAQNDVNFPSTDDMERFSIMWVNIIPDLAAPYRAYQQTIDPSSLDGDISDFTAPSLTNT